MNKFKKTDYIYTALFCEENIWKFIESNVNSADICFIDVLFIINPHGNIALFEQNMSDSDQPVIWDYHVIASAKINHTPVIFDFDSRCDFPCDIDTYFTKTFYAHDDLKPHYRPFIRRIDAAYFHENFTSDRHHMLNIIPQSNFPNYEIIVPNNTSRALSLEACRNYDSVILDSSIMAPAEYLKSFLLRPCINLARCITQ